MAAARIPTLVLDLVAGRLRIDGRAVELRPKTWAVLLVLVERSGHLVTKDELLDRVWPETAVSEGTLSKSIGELRAALDDRSDAPRFLETVPRRGFRWIGEAGLLSGEEPAKNAPSDPPRTSDAARPSDAPRPSDAAAPASAVIARDEELGRLEAGLARARTGQRQVIFVTGEAGAGKTTLVDRFLDGLAGAGPDAAALVAHGQCLETSGTPEPYLPLLDAFDRLARDRVAGAAVSEILRRCAPTWIAQMPSLAPAGTRPSTASPAAPGRMLREFVTAADEIARHRPLVLVLEDAHWADLATTDACSALARQRDGARLLMLVTKRSAEAMVREHPVVALRRDLVARRAAEEIALTPFGRKGLAAYLSARCPGLASQAEIGDWLLQQTAGNPLFVRLVVDEWVARGLVAPSSDGRWAPVAEKDELRLTVPDSLRALLERQVAQLAPGERAVLEAASVRVGEFHAASIAAASGLDAEEVEALCERIAQRGELLRDCGRVATADGRLAEQYAFLHATVQAVVASGLPSSRRRRLHLAAAAQLEREHEGRTETVASQLAVHYEAGGEASRAIAALRESSRVALRRDSPRDAIAILERAMDLIEATPGLERRDGERVLTMRHLSHARQLAYGFVDPEVAKLWSRTSELAASGEDLAERLVADAGRAMVACVTGRYAEAETVIREALPLVERVEAPGARQAFLFSSAAVRYRIAAMDDARALFEGALALENASDPVPGADFPAVLMSQYAPVLALTGQPDEARRLIAASLERARAHSHYSECVTSAIAAWALGLLHDFSGAAPIAARALELAEAATFLNWSTRPLFLLGMFAIREGRVDDGLAQVRAGLEGRERDGQLVDHSALCCLFAEALMDAGREGADEALQQGTDFAANSGELFYEAEILRLRAKALRLEGGPAAEVEDLLRRALELSGLRGIRWHGLLAARDLASLLLDAGRGADALAVLQPACAGIEGGDDLEPVRDAKALLERAKAAPGNP